MRVPSPCWGHGLGSWGRRSIQALQCRTPLYIIHAYVKTSVHAKTDATHLVDIVVACACGWAHMRGEEKLAEKGKDVPRAAESPSSKSYICNFQHGATSDMMQNLLSSPS